MYQESFRRIAYRRPLGFGVVDDFKRHGKIGKLVRIHMAVDGARFDDRHGRVFYDGADQLRAAARDELSTMMQYDYFVVNDDLKTAACQVDAILTAETRRVSRNEKAYQLLMEGKKL